jgi:transcriptional regulator with PAS, ATPase and Fis domain
VPNEVPTNVRDREHAGARLLVSFQGGGGTYDLAGKTEILVGRSEECDICILHGSVSRKHARLAATKSGWTIEDLGSANGTFVSGRRIERGQPVEIAPQVIVGVGDARLVIDAAPPAQEHDPWNEPMERVERLVELVADSTLPILLLGETGVGKGRMAETIHARSSRASKPFVRLNCAAVPEALLESELFGHERGAFTGAVQSKPGLLESADGGTAFLDEIGEMPRATQAKLLHVLEHGEVMRVGAVKPRAIDVRFIAATNRELESQVASGQFRRDLYFRLAGVPVLIPPLRDRPVEVIALAEKFVAEECARAKRAVPVLAPDARERLATHTWPGNIRELRNVMSRAALIANGPVIRADHLMLDAVPFSAPVSAPSHAAPTMIPPPPPLPSAVPPPQSARSLEDEVKETERRKIAEALERFGGHQGKAAEHLGISRRTLTNKLNELGFPRPRKDAK